MEIDKSQSQDFLWLSNLTDFEIDKYQNKYFQIQKDVFPTKISNTTQVECRLVPRPCFIDKPDQKEETNLWFQQKYVLYF